jgi:ribosomal protein S18 acetylase RimI-like enzyme
MPAAPHGGSPLMGSDSGTNSLSVRPVREAEYEAAGRLVVSAYGALPGAHLSDGYATLLADVGRRAAEAEVLVAVGPKLVGCVTFVPGPSSPWAEGLMPEEAGVRMLAVEPAAQGRGVGRALLDACVARARQMGRTGLFLHSTPWMHAAHHLYETAGFARVEARDWLPVPEVPLLAFRLELDEH